MLIFGFDCALFCAFAVYPAFSTARMISSGAAVPSTVIEFVSRLTEQDETPSTPPTAFSTLAEHAAQLIPPTSYLSIISPLSLPLEGKVPSLSEADEVFAA